MAVSVSQDFILHVRNIFYSCLNEVKNGKVYRNGINGYSRHALPAYICAVASVEAFINETLLGIMSKHMQKESPIWNLSADWLERLEISKKLILVPQLLFNDSFKNNEQPYQDMAILVRIRNDLVHYKMGMAVPSYISALDQRRITLQVKNDVNADFDWIYKLSCTEGVRWANTTVCKVVARLVMLMPKEIADVSATSLASNFQEISEKDVINWYKSQGIDPMS